MASFSELGCLQKSMILLKLIFTTAVEIDFYHNGSWFLQPWKVFLFFSEWTHHFNILQVNKEAQCNGIKIYEVLVSSCQVQSLLKCHPAITDGPINCGFSELGVACRILLGTWLRSEARRSWAYTGASWWFDCMTGYPWWQPLMPASCKWLWQWVPSHQRQKVRGVGNINALLLWCTDHRPFSFLKRMVSRWAFDQFSNTVWTLQWHC